MLFWGKNQKSSRYIKMNSRTLNPARCVALVSSLIVLGFFTGSVTLDRQSLMETIPETVLIQEMRMPYTEADEKMSGEIQNFARQMTQDAIMYDPEIIIDQPKTIQLDFTREVKVGESLKETKSYTLIASYSLFENVRADVENQVDDWGEQTEKGVRFCGVYDDLNTPADFEEKQPLKTDGKNAFRLSRF
jgi:hypothetical protein